MGWDGTRDASHHAASPSGASRRFALRTCPKAPLPGAHGQKDWQELVAALAKLQLKSPKTSPSLSFAWPQAQGKGVDHKKAKCV